jgi:hypothetical protein
MAAAMVNAIPTANTNLVGFGFGFGATVPLLAVLLVPVPVLVSSLPDFRDANRGGGVSYFTLHCGKLVPCSKCHGIEFQKSRGESFAKTRTPPEQEKGGASGTLTGLGFKCVRSVQWGNTLAR